MHHQIPSKEDIAGTLERIEKEQALGRSENYYRLLEYLVKQSLLDNEEALKELEIAVEVFHRDSSFVSQDDAIVRVSVYKLRQKLEAYYQKLAESLDASERAQVIVFKIPTGAYLVRFFRFEEVLSDFATLDENHLAEETTDALAEQSKQAIEAKDSPSSPPDTALPPSWIRSNAFPLLLGSGIAALIFFTFFNPEHSEVESQANSLLSEVSSAIPDDDATIIAYGDLYTYGIQDRDSMHNLLIADYKVNNLEELEEYFKRYPLKRKGYFVAQRKVVPEATLEAAAKISAAIPVDTSFALKAASRLTPEDIRDNHLIYVGTFAPLKSLADMMESLPITVDDYQRFSLQNSEQTHSSDGNPNEKHLDEGVISIFKSPFEKYRIVVAGFHRTSIQELSEILISREKLSMLFDEYLDFNLEENSESLPQSFSMVIAVDGFESTNLASRIVEFQRLEFD